MTFTPQQNISTAPFLRVTRNIPTEIQPLVIELNRIYPDIANAVNHRTIGVYAQNQTLVTGESWYLNALDQPLNSAKQQTIRKMYAFGAIASGTELDIPHQIMNFSSIQYFTKVTAIVATNVPDFRQLNYAFSGAEAVIIAGSTNIRIVLSATFPAVVRGVAILEWMGNP